jgi:ribosome recycling factor
VAVRDAQTLVVNLYDPSTRAAVESAIRAANLGLQPQAAGEGGNVLYIAVPPPSGEQRARLLKLVAAAAESARAAGRRVRQDALDQLRRSSQGGSTDDARRLEKQVQNAADSYTKAVAAVVESKEKAV